ncbi:MAG: hypothetical protein Tp118SUR00d2C21406351_17 [Prokaryotic dsDNA virus sp.]|nr:MAG: hypothetical protein Tp118SUR00d2C21406351_17 [Prokaryotic dsDNA virus sp.]|tara:strand:- start:11646 stop:12302 length:657 start_codon:yes stop_codon:yes gene_type:complete
MTISPDRIYAQYRDKPKAVAWYNILPTQAAQIETVLNDIRFSYDIDVNEGAQLDVIGNIVDISRQYRTKFEEISPPFIVDGAVDDDVYRILIKSKILKNNSDATLDTIVDSIQFISDATNARVLDHHDMSFSLIFQNALTNKERYILNVFDIVPRPQGVRFRGFVEEGNASQYGSGVQYNDGTQYGRYFGAYFNETTYLARPDDGRYLTQSGLFLTLY